MTCVPLLVLAVLMGQAPVRPGSSPQATSPDPEMPRPIAARDTVFIEEMTWLEVRDAMRAGRTTVIVATGGVEMNDEITAQLVHWRATVTADAIRRARTRRPSRTPVAPGRINGPESGRPIDQPVDARDRHVASTTVPLPPHAPRLAP